MVRYPEYREVNNVWMQEIPSHWQHIPLKRILTVSSGDFHNSEDDSDENFGYPIYGGNGLRGYSRKYNSEGELLLIGRVGAKCGNVHLVNGRYWVSEHALKVIQKKDFDRRFFKYLIERVDLNQYAIKTAQPLINTSIVEQQIVCLPPLNEQTAIANFLDHKTGLINDLIAKKEQLIELLKEERTAIIKQAVTKGLDPNMPMKDSGIEWLGEIPEHWKVKRLKFLANSVQTGSTPPTGNSEYYDEPNFDWYTPVDFSNGIYLNESNRKLNSVAVESGIAREFNSFTVLIVGIGATLGKIGIIQKPSSANQQINAVIFNKDQNPIFHAYYLQAIETILKMMSDAATLAILNQNSTKNVLMVCPLKDEQDTIAEIIDNLFYEVDLRISKIYRQIEFLQEYKTALINEAVTGKIMVTDAD